MRSTQNTRTGFNFGDIIVREFRRMGILSSGISSLRDFVFRDFFAGILSRGFWFRGFWRYTIQYTWWKRYIIYRPAAHGTKRDMTRKRPQIYEMKTLWYFHYNTVKCKTPTLQVTVKNQFLSKIYCLNNRNMFKSGFTRKCFKQKLFILMKSTKKYSCVFFEKSIV